MALNKLLRYISLSVFAFLVQNCAGNYVQEPKQIPEDVWKAYHRKSWEEKIREGAFGLPEHQDRIKHFPTGDNLDCNVRYLAYNYSKKLLSPSANLKAVLDGLELSKLCGITPNVPKRQVYREHEKKVLEIKIKEKYVEYFVDPKAPESLNTVEMLGTKYSPFRDVNSALKACESGRLSTNVHCIIRLREGTHFLESPIQLTPKHSNVVLAGYVFNCFHSFFETC